MAELFGIQPLVDIISLCLQSGFVKNEKNGVSLIIISKPEGAKTSSIFKFSNLDFVAYYDEITAKKILDEFIPLVKNNNYKFLLIPDLLNCIEKQRSTKEQFLSVIKSAIDDTGIKNISTYHKNLNYAKMFEGIKFCLITAITSGNFKNIQKYMVNTGLLSRFLPFTYDYPIDKVKSIFNIIEDGGDGDVFVPKIVKEEKDVVGDGQLFKEFEIISIKLGSFVGAYGFRAQLMLQRLAKANALLNGRDYVTKEDIDKVISLSKWINYDFNVI